MEELVRKFNKKFEGTDWNNGNCYWYSVLLSERFRGEIYYQVALGHFCTRLADGYFYDHTGRLDYEDDQYMVRWSEFEAYDSLQKKRIERDVILDI